MNKKIKDLTEKELIWKFLTELKMTIGNDSVFIRNEEGFFSVLHIDRCNLIRDKNLLDLILKQKNINIDFIQDKDVFEARYETIKIVNQNLNKAKILSYLIYLEQKNKI